MVFPFSFRSRRISKATSEEDLIETTTDDDGFAFLDAYAELEGVDDDTYHDRASSPPPPPEVRCTRFPNLSDEKDSTVSDDSTRLGENNNNNNNNNCVENTAKNDGHHDMTQQPHTKVRNDALLDYDDADERSSNSVETPITDGLSRPDDDDNSAEVPITSSGGALGLQEDFVTLLAPGKVADYHRTMAYAMFRGRLRRFDIPLMASLKERGLPVVYRDSNGTTMELLAVKVKKKNSNGAGFGTKEISAYYVTTSGPHMPTSIQLQATLERVAGFGRVPPSKLPSRIELLLSPTRPPNCTKTIPTCDNGVSSSYLIPLDEVEEIREDANVGCGFVPAAWITQRFLGGHAVGKRTFALQVRVYAPSLGIFKGMVVAKQGIEKLQLPLSMKKVGPSETVSHSTVRLSITQGGIFPSDRNVQVAKLLDGLRVSKSFQLQELNPMIQRLLCSLGIPEVAVRKYSKDATKAEHLAHANFVGVCDPTGGQIPANTVFLTGFDDNDGGMASSHHVIVTRYPCTGAQDARLLPVLTSQPDGMTDIAWAFLSSLHFGGIVFGNPVDGGLPIPSTIADGDLDGDIYFTCWKPEFVDVAAQKARFHNGRSVKPSLPDRNISNFGPVNTTWLRDTQERMANVGDLDDMFALVSALHSQWKKAAGDDAASFGAAYKEALDVAKHGKLVTLPTRLWPKVSENLRRFLQSEDGETFERPSNDRKSEDEEKCSSMKQGDRVLITMGKYKGKHATFIRRTEKRVRVLIDWIQAERSIAPDRVILAQ